MRFAVKLLPVLLLAGCASMSKSECLTADWRAVGYEDGASGAPVAAMTARREACAKKAAVAPDFDAWLAGRVEGLKHYCRPSNGFVVGARGETYHGVCEGPQSDLFLAEYQSGALLFDMQRMAAATSSALSHAQTELWSVKRRIAVVETALLSPATRNAERVDYLLELKNLVKERSELDRRVRSLEIQLAEAEGELADYRSYLAEAPAGTGTMRPTQASY